MHWIRNEDLFSLLNYLLFCFFAPFYRVKQRSISAYQNKVNIDWLITIMYDEALLSWWECFLPGLHYTIHKALGLLWMVWWLWKWSYVMYILYLHSSQSYRQWSESKQMTVWGNSSLRFIPPACMWRWVICWVIWHKLRETEFKCRLGWEKVSQGAQLC